MNKQNITLPNLDNYLNDYLSRGRLEEIKPLSALDIECMYIEHLAKAYNMLFDSLEQGVSV